MAGKRKAPSKPVEVVKVEIYKDDQGDWRWRALAANSAVVAAVGEGLKNRMYARKVARDLFPGATVEFV